MVRDLAYRGLRQDLLDLNLGAFGDHDLLRAQVNRVPDGDCLGDRLLIGMRRQRLFIHSILGLGPVLGRRENEWLVRKFDRWSQLRMLLRVLTALVLDHLGPLLLVLPKISFKELPRVLVDTIGGQRDEVVAFEG